MTVLSTWNSYFLDPTYNKEKLNQYHVIYQF